jgi:hypothetical protein
MALGGVFVIFPDKKPAAPKKISKKEPEVRDAAA